MSFREVFLELLKSFLDFIVGLTDNLIWPLVVILLFWWLKDEIKQIIKRITKIESDRLSFHFAKTLEKMTQRDEGDSVFDVTHESLDYTKYQRLLACTGVISAFFALDLIEQKTQDYQNFKKTAFQAEEKLRKENFDSDHLSELSRLNSKIRKHDESGST